MALILSGNVATATAAVGYNVANSCRFNSGDSPDLKKTISSAGNRKTWTFSAWVKRSKFGASQNMFSGGTDGDNQNYTRMQFMSTEEIYISHVDGGGTTTELQTNQVFRDPSAWYHIVWAVDTTQGTAANREKLYVNGVQITSFDTGTDDYGFPAEDYETTMNEDVDMFVGNQLGTWEFSSGYFAEVCFIDGTAYAASDFGEFDEDSPTIWKPKDVSGLTFGTNGAYLDFEDSDNLGDDESGNTNDFAEDNLAAVDQCQDSPTNNFCTFNPLAVVVGAGGGTAPTFSEGNTEVTCGDTTVRLAVGTFATSMPYYFEAKVSAISGSDSAQHIGVLDSGAIGSTSTFYSRYEGNGDAAAAGESDDTGNDTMTANDIIGVAVDLATNNNVKFYENGDLQATMSVGAAYQGLVTTPYARMQNATTTFQFNFGNPAYANSSDAADANGYGAFEYAPPSGYFALCTKNLAEEG